jgi:hypothetical protein
MHHQQASKRLQTTCTGAWPVWLVRLVLTALCDRKIIPKDGGWYRAIAGYKAAMSAEHTDTSIPSFICATYKNKQVHNHNDRIWTKGPKSHQWFFMVEIDSSGFFFIGRMGKPGMYFYPKQAKNSVRQDLKPLFPNRCRLRLAWVHRAQHSRRLL